MISQTPRNMNGSPVSRWLRPSAIAVPILSIITAVSLVANIPPPVPMIGSLLTLVASAIVLYSLPDTQRESRMNSSTDRAGNLLVDLTDAGISVKVPPQGKPVQVQRLPFLPLEKMRSTSDEFKPRRVAANFEIVEADNPDTIVTNFKDPIEVRIQYTKDDVESLKVAIKAYRLNAQKQTSQGSEPTPQLGFWDGTRWIRFTKEKHNLRWEPAEPPAVDSGVGIVTLREWADPPVGAGP